MISLIKAAAKVIKYQKQLRRLCPRRSLEADCVFFQSNGNPISKRKACIDNWNKQMEQADQGESKNSKDLSSATLFETSLWNCPCFKLDSCASTEEFDAPF